MGCSPILRHAPAAHLWQAPTRIAPISYGWECANGLTLNGPDVDNLAEQYAGGNALNFWGGRPLYEAAGWNALEPSANMDGVAEFGNCDAAAAVVSGAATHATILIAVQLLALPGALGGIFSFGHSATVGYYDLQVTAGGVLQVAHNTDAGALLTENITTAADLLRHVITIVHYSGMAYVYIDGVEDAASPLWLSAAATTLDRFSVGCIRHVGAAASFQNMRFALCQIYPSSLTADQVRAASKSAARYATWI
jgi:hypothetical protein